MSINVLKLSLHSFRPRPQPSVYSLLFFFVVLGLTIVQTHFFSGNIIALEKLPVKDGLTTLDEAQKLAIQMLVSRSDLLASWALAIIAALGAIINLFGHIKDDLLTMLFSFLTFCIALVATFMSHISSTLVLEALFLHRNPLDDERLIRALQVQYICLLMAVVLFVAIAIFIATGKKADATT